MRFQPFDLFEKQLDKQQIWNTTRKSIHPRSPSEMKLHLGSVAVPYHPKVSPLGYARYYVTGGEFPVGLNSLHLNSPCNLLVKPDFLAACISPHQYEWDL